MKKAILIFLMSAIALGANSQLVQVIGIEKLDVTGYYPQFVPGSDDIIVTGQNFKGLKAYNLTTKDEIVISEESGAGYEAVVQSDEVRFDTKDHGSYSYVWSSGSRSKISEESLVSARRIGTDVFAEATRDLRAIEVNGLQGTKVIKPLGEADYLNVSVSPDQTKLAFRVSGLGSFVTDMDGNVLRELGDVEFPKWVDNHTVLYTNTKDDGYQYVSSTVMIASLDNIEGASRLTDLNKQIALFPAVNSLGTKVLFHTPNGEIYLLNVDREQ